MYVVYVKQIMSCLRALKWHKRFLEGRVSLKFDANPGLAHRVTTPPFLLLLLRLVISYGEINSSLLKKGIRGYHFVSDEDVCDWVKNWFDRHPTSVFKNGIDNLVSQ